MKLKYLKLFGLIMITMCLFFTSCEQDNYSLPSGGIKGSVFDSNNETVQTEQPNGIKIRLIEEKYGDGVTPNDFWCQADGTFENDFVFEGKYKVTPIEGAFFPIDPIEIDIKGVTEVDFNVIPFLTIDASVNVENGNIIIIAYTLSRDQVGGKIMQAKTLVSAYPTVSNTINEMNITHDLSSIDDVEILDNQYTDTITDLTLGTYYIRVGAIAENSYNKYNYSKIFEVSIP